jgi:hypothetical protein
MQDEKLGRRRRRLIACISFCILQSAFCMSTPAITQDDVFKSIQQNVSESEGAGRTFLAVLLGAAAIVMLLAILSARRRREASPKALNHQGKLLKEVARKVGLRPAEVRQLKAMAEAERAAGQTIESPLVYLLCPSVLTATMRSGRVKVDKKVMAGIARKLGLIAPAKSK